MLSCEYCEQIKISQFREVLKKNVYKAVRLTTSILWKFWPILPFIKWQNNPKYDNLSKNFHIFLTASGEGGGSKPSGQPDRFIDVFFFEYFPNIAGELWLSFRTKDRDPMSLRLCHYDYFDHHHGLGHDVMMIIMITSTSLYYISLYLGWEIWSTQKYKYKLQRSIPDICQTGVKKNAN